MIASDFYETGGSCGFDPVMPIGVDTLGLVAAVMYAPAAETFLDLWY